ncbi:hypothetical protein BCR33DRAFT_835334 [Rhizoclosmatium globosum]|uniref:Uncharacterized protein n=1 Tax=Rhizoclosmatium globosum TaxID=329046 RepID=A0A1Y2BPG6_9FUNG|nr:hypothetical protein BCR33DRAFT_835334 [Rhizoclosmatium globosum]|eukprot:ORY36649.1 hypothetical protein BCR33DRAFT_835334 [Rhizoclosmatium globosum]
MANPRVLLGAGCLLQKRLAVRKKKTVFADLFSPMDFSIASLPLTQMVLSMLPCLVLEIGQDGTNNSSTSLTEILRWFTWLMTAIK